MKQDIPKQVAARVCTSKTRLYVQKDGAVQQRHSRFYHRKAHLPDSVCCGSKNGVFEKRGRCAEYRDILSIGAPLGDHVCMVRGGCSQHEAAMCIH